MIIGLTGYAQSGKDTAALALIEQGFTRIAFADILRQSVYNLNPIVTFWPENAYEGGGYRVVRVQDIVDDIGWDAAKVLYPEIRELLQRFGTEVGRELYGVDFWVEMALNQINYVTEPEYLPNNIATSWTCGSPTHVGNYVITDVRFPNEEKAVHEIGGTVVRVLRPGTGAVNSHTSDTSVDLLDVDKYVFNDGTIEEFKVKVLSLLD